MIMRQKIIVIIYLIAGYHSNWRQMQILSVTQVSKTADRHNYTSINLFDISIHAFMLIMRRYFGMNNNNNAGVFILRRLHSDDNERVITTL